MALRGNLKDFSLPDVFQLITFSRKTGVLRIVRSDAAHGSVWFRDGDVFFASSNWHTQPLGERLVSSQRITPQALERALELRAGEPEAGRRLGQILVDEAYITEKVLEGFVQEQIQDTIFDLMRWDDGEFDFEPMPTVVEEDIGLAVSIENVVMEGSRRLEEWARIRKKIPSMDVVFKMATAPGEGTFEISLKPMEWQLLVLVDGSMSVAELAAATHRTDFEVARVVYGLFSAGLLEFATDDEVTRNRAERLQREARLSSLEAQRVQPVEKPAPMPFRDADEIAPEVAAAPQAAGQPVAEVEGVELPLIPVVSAPLEPAYEGPAEIPEFLGAQGDAPTDEDQVVLEEFMGAILGVPAEVPEPVAVQPAPRQAHVPAEEPAFITHQPQDTVEADLVGVQSVEEMLGISAPAPVEYPTEPPLAAIDTELAEVEPAATEAVAADLEASMVSQPADLTDVEDDTRTSAASGESFASEYDESATESVADEPPLADGFARELMALGLGELDSGAEIEHEPGFEAVPESEATDVLESASAVVDSGPEVPSVGDAQPVSDSIDEDVEWLGEIVSTELTIEAVPTASEPAPATFEDGSRLAEETASSDMDFSGLIESLEVGDEDELPVREPASQAVEGFDDELLRDAESERGSGVISTDAYLSDISIDDLGFSGGLNDELSALTGAERRGAPVRPTASVNPLPEEGAGLHRDLRVDRETLLRIIDGIERL